MPSRWLLGVGVGLVRCQEYAEGQGEIACWFGAPSPWIAQAHGLGAFVVAGYGVCVTAYPPIGALVIGTGRCAVRAGYQGNAAAAQLPQLLHERLAVRDQSGARGGPKSLDDTNRDSTLADALVGAKDFAVLGDGRY